MGENSNFSIYSVDVPTCQNITVAISPTENTASYTYFVYKDNVIVDKQQIIGMNSANINLTETGNYQIWLNMYDANNNLTNVKSGNYIIDKEAPIINVESYLEVKKGDTIDNPTATDNYDNVVNVTSNIDSLDLNKQGHQKLVYTAYDTAGNKATKVVDVNVVHSDNPLFAIQVFLIICLLGIVLVALRFKKSLKLEKRIEAYALSPKLAKNSSFAEMFSNEYKKLNHKLTKVLSKSVFAKKYAKKLDKYVAVTTNHQNGMEILTLKILSAFALLVIAFIADVIQVKFMPLYEIGLPLLVGFFIPDIVYFTKYKVYRRTVENDLLSAIIIMNNAFKAGRNITQAIDIVGEELDGVIAEEFKKMSLELSYGLEIDVIFKRFAERVKLEEVSYLTASLTVLNKTGGNIVEVFSSIEKTMFNKKKLRLELNSLTGSSKLIVYILLAIPFFFVLVISVISPGYFLPFITTDLGIFLLGCMIIYYIIFVVVVRKIMKVVI